jgi:dTDP-4-dehydrorhamnose 3,5-epimerase
MEITAFSIAGPLLITPRVYEDERGCFIETFQAERYAQHIPEHFVQDNLSKSKKGVLRGLHFQSPPFAQGKLVQVMKGRVLDVAVDIRSESPTYGQHVLVELDANKMQQFYVPPGFAHGFIALEEDTLFAYKCTALYSPTHEKTLLWNDTDLNIAWPSLEVIVNQKDMQGTALKDLPTYF